MNEGRKTGAIIGILELIPFALLFAAKVNGLLPHPSPWWLAIGFGAGFLLLVDGILRTLEAVIQPPPDVYRWYRPLMLGVLAVAIVIIEVGRSTHVPTNRGITILLGVLSTGLGIYRPTGLTEMVRSRFATGAIGPRWVRWLYVGVGIALLLLGIFGPGLGEGPLLN